MLGDGFYFISIAFMIGKLSGDSANVGINVALETLPFLVLGPYAGAIADRVDRRKIVVNADILCFALLALFALTVPIFGSPPIWAFYVNSVLYGCIRVFFHPAKNAAIPRIVPAEDLPEANAANSAMSNFMPLLSLGFSAAILSQLYNLQPNLFFLASVGLNALSFLVSAVFCWQLPSIEPTREEVEARPHVLEDIRIGLSFLKSRKDLLAHVGLSFLTSVSISPFFVFYVESNKQWFGGHPSGITYNEAIFFAGMVIMSAYLPKFKIKRVGLAWIWGIAPIGFAVAMMAFSRVFGVYLFWNLVCGLALPFALLPMGNYVQVTVPDNFRGRHGSILTLVSTGAMPIGSYLGAIIISRIGLVPGYLAMGTCMAVAALLGLLVKPFREAALPDQALVEPEPEPEKAIA